MNVRAIALASIAVLGPCVAHAQSTTADGVRAFVRGDYPSAARILRPLAEAPSPDPTAQFFLAILYEAGRGVERNTFRACGLYLSAAKPENPFMLQSQALAEIILEPMPAFARSFCSADPWTPGPRETIQIGPNHVFRWDETGATVSYNGEERHTRMQMGGPGWLFLPTRHTAVDVTRPRATTRHFIDLMFWRPTRSATETTWTLAWGLWEVDGVNLTVLPGDPNVLTVSGPRPPSIDPEKVVAISANESGEAEWAVLIGDTRRRTVIPVKDPK